MEAVVMMHRSVDQSISPYKSHNIRSYTKNIHVQNPFVPRVPYENFMLNTTNGLVHAPLPHFMSHSYPPYSFKQPQPPLLPRPATVPRHASSRGLSCTPGGRKTNNRTSRDSSLTPKKSKSPKKVQGKNSSPKKSNSDCVTVSPTSLLGPDPRELPKVDVFSGSVVCTISPPPSSLPLPTFSLRPKVSCKVEAAAGIDTGATDGLRRLLRIR